jgi:hypothetical protein
MAHLALFLIKAYVFSRNVESEKGKLSLISNAGLFLEASDNDVKSKSRKWI